MDSIRLIQTDKSDSEFFIKVETKIGRGPVFDISDKKVSRNHAILTPIFDESKLELKSTHINPCFIQIKGEEKKLVLEKDSSMKLGNGDVFSLLANKHSFRVVSEPSKNETAEKNGKIAFVKNLSQKQEPKVTEEKKDDTPDEKKLPDVVVDVPDTMVVKSKDTTAEPSSETNTEGRKLPGWMNSSSRSPKAEKPADEEDDGSSYSPEDDLKAKDTSDKASSSSEKDDSETKPSNGSQSDEKKTSNKRTKCVYGKKCYRKNPQHLDEFVHPDDSDYAALSDDDDEDSDNSTKPVCPYGSKCYRKNPAHRKQYCHPSTSKSAASTSKKSSDEDESSSDEGPTRRRRPTRKSRKKQQQQRVSDDDIPSSESDIVDSDEEDVYDIAKEEDSESMSDEEDWRPKSKRRKKTPPPPKVKETKKKKKKGYNLTDSEVSGEDEMSIYDDDESDAGFSYDDDSD